MNILFVHPKNDFTGSTKVLSDVINEYYKNDNTIVLTISNDEGFLSYIDGLQVTRVAFPTFKGTKIPLVSSLLSLFDRTVKFIKEAKGADYIYINTIKPYYAAILSHIMRKKIIWHIHEKYTTGTPWHKFLEFIQSHTNAHFIFVSKYVESQYVISPKSSSEIRYNKLTVDFRDQINVKPIDERQMNTILMASGLSESKGVYNFVEIARAQPEYNFHLVLSCTEEEKKIFIETVNPPDNCIIWSRQKDMHAHYFNSDIIVNLTIPSLCVETFGMTILEGMAYGLPVIAPNVGGPLEIVRNGIDGFCVDVSDLDVVKDSINYILSKPEIYQKFCSSALKRSQVFSY